MDHKKIFWLLIALVVLIGLFFASLYLKDQIPKEKLPANSTSEPSSVEQTFGYFYKFISSYDPSTQFETRNEKNYDGKIVKVERDTNQETVVIDSIKEAYPPINASFNFTLIPAEVSNHNPDYLYFHMTALETGGGSSDIIRFDGADNTFTKLSIGSSYDSFAAKTSPFSPFAASILDPNNPSDNQTLYVLDFENDKVVPLETLPQSQTYNICSIEGCMMGTLANIEWITEDSFSVKIYNSRPGPIDSQTRTPTPILIENKVYKIN